MKNNKALFSSNADNWSTPQDFFSALNSVFEFDLDAAAESSNAKCEKFISPEEDALTVQWHERGSRIWLNPPYGKTLPRWVEKVVEASTNGETVVCLLPARTDTNWFSAVVEHCAALIFLKGRLKFEGASNGAPFPSLIAVFGNIDEQLLDKVVTGLIAAKYEVNLVTITRYLDEPQAKEEEVS